MLAFLRLVVLLFFGLWSGLCWGDLAQETVYLTWLRSPSTTMTVQWISAPKDIESVVFYRPAMTKTEWKKVQGESFSFPQSPEYLVHRATIKDLQADSTYCFKIGANEKEFQFLTAPANLTKELKFVVGGDMYHDALEIMAKTCRTAAATTPLFAVVGGDIAYAVKSVHSPVQHNERWVAWIKTWHATMKTAEGNMIPVIAAVGNHDVVGQYDQTPAQAAVFSLLFPMPGKQIYNVLDFNSYLIITLLDSGHANPINGEQTKWLNRILEGRQAITHRFAFYHVPAYPCVRNFQNRQSELIRQSWVPLFEKWGVQVAFEHHDHAYKRTHPLKKSRSHPEGIVYMGDGGWGVEKPRKIRIKRPFIAKFASARHFISVAITPTEQYFKSIDDEGQLIDEWTNALKPNKQAPPSLQNRV